MPHCIQATDYALLASEAVGTVIVANKRPGSALAPFLGLSVLVGCAARLLIPSGSNIIMCNLWTLCMVILLGSHLHSNAHATNKRCASFVMALLIVAWVSYAINFGITGMMPMMHSIACTGLVSILVMSYKLGWRDYALALCLTVDAILFQPYIGWSKVIPACVWACRNVLWCAGILIYACKRSRT